MQLVWHIGMLSETLFKRRINAYGGIRFTYSVSFSALIATSAAEFGFWPGISGNSGISGGIIYLCIPLCLVLINALEVEVSLIYPFYSGYSHLNFGPINEY